MDFITSIFKGFIIGIGAILPGISSGVLCVIFGIYDKLVKSVLEIFKDFKKNFLFLLPLLIGGIVGFFLFGKILDYFFITYNSESKSLFLGFILGGIPSLFKVSKQKSEFRPYYVLFTFLSFSISLFLVFLETKMHTLSIKSDFNFIYIFIAGFSMSAGIIIPGISSTVILMCFGIYDTYLEAISILDFSFLIPLGIGLALGCIIFLILIKKLLNRFPSQTFYSIIGFVLGSTLILVPNNFNLLIILLFFLGFFITFGIDQKKC